MRSLHSYYLLWLLCVVVQAGTPTFINETDCSLELSIETSCSGEIIGKHTVNAEETYHILPQYDDYILPQNQSFCLTVKPTCKDTLIQNIQTISPYFHDHCIIRYQSGKNGEKVLVPSTGCSTPKTA